MLTGTAVVFGYALLGATWLIMKTDGPTQTIVYGEEIDIDGAIAALDAVTLEPDPSALSAACADGDRAAEAVAALSRAGVRIAGFTLGQPSLDEVFLALTGRPVGDSEPQTEEVPA